MSAELRCFALWASLLWCVINAPGIAAQATYVIAPEYRGTTISRGALAIAPIAGGLVIDNVDDLRDDLGSGDPAEVFVSFFKTQLPVLLKEESNLSDVRYGSYQGAPALAQQTRVLGKKWLFWSDRMNIFLPAEGSTVQFADFRPDFILFFEDFTAERSSEPWPPDGVATVLRYRAKFAIWDRNHGRVVCYGRADAFDAVWLQMTRRTWEKALNELAAATMRHCPFRN